MEEAEYLYLSDDCWERVFKYLNDGDDDDDYDYKCNLKFISAQRVSKYLKYGDDDDDYDYKCYLKSISAVSKQLFSITNRLRLSLNVYDPTVPFLPRLFHRFTNLTSLDLTNFHGDLDALLRQISLFPLKLTSLNLSNKPTIPADGLRAFSQNITTLTSLTCSKLHSFTSNHLFLLIAECFPLLEQLDLSYPRKKCYNLDGYGIEALSLSLSKLRKINLSGHFYIDDKSIFHLFNNCKLLQEAILPSCRRITKEGVASALSVTQTTLRCLSIPYYITPQLIGSLVSLKGLTDINLSLGCISDELLTSLAIGLPWRRIVLCSCIYSSYAGLFSVLSKCQSIQHLNLQDTRFQNNTFFNDRHVADLSLYLAGLVSVNLSRCSWVTGSSLFALVRNCPSLSEITMESIGGMWTNDYLTDFGVYPQLKSLNLSHNILLGDESITMFASVFPNLHRLELTSCSKISDESIVHVLRRCRKLSHLNLSRSNLKLLGMNFEVPKLKMLDLSLSKVGDEALYSISNNCCGLLQLLIDGCSGCTEEGVKNVVEKCSQLREISLDFCFNVRTNVAASMLFSSPSLRKITAPSHIRFSESERILLLQRGCIVCSKV